MLVPDLNVNVFRINRTSLKDPLMQFFCFFLSQKKRLQDTCEEGVNNEKESLEPRDIWPVAKKTWSKTAAAAGVLTMVEA